MKLYFKKLAALFYILFVSVTVSVGQNKPTVLTELEIVGNWQVNVGASIEQDGKIRNVSSFVTIEQPTRIQVTDELYENLRPYDSEGGGWSNGFALRGVEASGCSHYDGLWPETVEVRTAVNNGGVLLERGVDYQFEPRWGVIGALPGGQISSTDKIYISYVHTPQRVDSIILSATGEIIVRKGIPASSLPQIPELQQDEILLANIYFDHRETKLVDENLFPLMGEISEGQVTPTAKRYLPKTLAKLRNGEKLRVLAWGDSVTAGAYLPGNLRWPQQFVEQLKERFPRANIELVVEAWGGYSTQMYMLEPPESDLNYEKKVVSVNPDLIVMEFVNDAAMDMESLRGTYERILSDMQPMGTEMLILTPHYIRPDWMGFASQKYIDEDPRPYVKFLHEFTSCNKIALADGSAGFGELWRRGIPYNIMMANCINHPDERGMQIFVDALMAVFPFNVKKQESFSLQLPKATMLNKENCLDVVAGNAKIVSAEAGEYALRLFGPKFRPVELKNNNYLNSDEGVIEFKFIPQPGFNDLNQMIISQIFYSKTSAGSVSIGINHGRGMTVPWFYLNDDASSRINFGIYKEHRLKIGKVYKFIAAWDRFNMYLFINGELVQRVEKKFNLSFGNIYVLGQSAGVRCDLSDLKISRKCLPVKSGYQLFIQSGYCSKDVMYSVGQQVKFPVVAWKDGREISKGQVKVVLSNDGKMMIQRWMFNLAKEKAVGQGTLKQPGFLRCDTTLIIDDKTVAKTASTVGFDPEKIKIGAPAPADFEDFWKKGIAHFAEIPLDVSIVDAPDLSNAIQSCSRISFATGNGTRLYGFLSVPKAKGKFPVVIVVPGAGPSISNPREFLIGEAIVLFLNVHAYEPVADRARLLKAHDSAYASVPGGEYPLLGVQNPETYFFRRVYLGFNRAVDYMARYPKFDGEHLGVTGSSQGGGSALILAGLNPKINYVVANVPGFCDHGGYLKKRPTGWPHFDVMLPGNVAAQKTASYFDVAYFAENIHCPVIVIVGLVDSTCPPSSVYAAFNEIASSEKTIVPEPDMGHFWPASYGQSIAKMMKYFQKKHR